MTNARTAVSDRPEGMDDDTLAAAVATLAAHIHAATWRLLVLIAELDRRKLWAAQGAMSCAHWLSWACGIDAHTAREKVRVARALENLPLLSEALSKGELGYSKVRALSRVATADNEAYLLDIGRHGTAAHVEKFARLYRQASRANETERADARHRERGLTFWHEDDGTVVLHGRFPPEMAARIVSALEAAMAAHAAEQRPRTGARNIPARRTSHVGRRPRSRRSPCAGPMRSRGWPTGCSRRATPRPSRRTGTRSSCTWTPRCLRGAGRGDAKSSLTRLLQGRRRGVFAAMRVSSPRSMDPPASRLLSDGAPAPFPPRCAVRCSYETADAASPGAPPPTGCTDITCVTGPRGAKPRSTTWFCSARSTTGWCTRGASRCIGSMTGRTASSLPRGGRSGRRSRPAHSSPEVIVDQNEALGLAIDGRTATARWDGQPVDYDQAVMVAMASWGPAGTGSEAAATPEAASPP